MLGDERSSPYLFPKDNTMYLNVTVYSPVGTFIGTLSRESETKEALEKTRDVLQTRPDGINYLVLFAGDDEVLIPGEVFKVSVTHFAIQDKPAKGYCNGRN